MPLHFASSIEIAEYLLDHGADINARDVDHESTAAQYMARERQEVARYLVKRGCRTDILMAAALGDMELVRKHLKTDPDCIHTSVSDDYFPRQNPHSGGTIYNWVLGSNKTAHLIAREFGHEDAFRFLMEQSSDELKLSVACGLGDERLVKELLLHHPNLGRTLSEDECRKLAHAARDNKIETVRLMLEAGWPVDVRGQHQATPLHWAAFHGNALMAEIILRYHPLLEAKDADFAGTPIGWAIHGSEHGWHCKTGDYPRTVEALLKAGAKRPEESKGTEALRRVLEQFSK